ncbi:hypothetical protein LCGC14_3081220 [marine sediment metagenome]|uniref:Uncharacterized protein n=1 Tax=marine sediment metagenome TaxID=412755 RepID=A0A0F8X1R9_9ZZZZ
MGKKVGNLTIWLNTFKSEEDQPDFRGKMDIGDDTYGISLWINHNVIGFPTHLSGQITEKEDGS